MIHRQLSCRYDFFTVITNVARSSVFPPLGFSDLSGFLLFVPYNFGIRSTWPIFNFHQNFLAVQLGEPSLKSFGVRVKRRLPVPSTNMIYNL